MIDSRISAIINFVPENSRVADIGADHGYLAIELAQSGRASFVVASDKNQGPLDAAKKNIAAAGLQNIIEARLGDGLQVLREGEVDTICIAGMGGALIVEILAAAPEILAGTENLILQPMNASDKVRAWLSANDLFHQTALAEVAGIIYEIISAAKIPATSTPKSSALAEKFTAQKISKLEKILAEMSKSTAAVQTPKFAQLQAELVRLKDSLKQQ
ncbi:MAG: SAM-dependent methyltransferase [Selenomonadaceae bacterium]|nr:SAM-dependent methyltransferase [Selenomonadaceae bacterium]